MHTCSYFGSKLDSYLEIYRARAISAPNPRVSCSVKVNNFVYARLGIGTCTDIEEVISNITYTICWNVCFFNVNIITGNLAIKGGSLHTKKTERKKTQKKDLGL